MAAIYDALGNVIGDDGQPSIDQMQYELAKNGRPSPLDKVTGHFKNIVTQFNPIMMPKVMQDTGTIGLNIGSSLVSPYADILHNVQAAGAAGLHRLAGDEQSALEAEARQRPVTMSGMYREPILPVTREAEQGLGQAFEASKLPPLGPGSGMPGTARISPRPLLTPNDLRVLGAEATRIGRQVAEIPTDYVNAQSGLQRIDPVTGQPVLGARLQSAAERLNELMEQRKMQGLTPIPGLPAALQPETSMFAVRPTGTRITTPTIPETAKGHSPSIDPINRFLKSLNIIDQYGKPTSFDVVHLINEQIERQPGNFTQLRNAFASFVEAKALEMFPEFTQPSDAMKAFNVKYANTDAQNIKEAEFFNEFIQTPEGQRLMPNAVSSQELSDRHEAAMQGLKNMWGKYFVKNLGTEGNPLVKIAAEKGLTTLPEEDVREIGARSYAAAKSNRGRIGMPVEGSFKAKIDETNRKLDDIALPLQNAVNAEQSLSAAAHAAGYDPVRVPEYREARDKAESLVKDRKKLKAQLDNLTLAAAYENIEDSMVQPADASTVFLNLSPYERQLYPDLAEAARRGEKAFVANPRDIERLFKDSAEKFYADVMAGNIDKSKAATYPVDKFIRESAESRIKMEKAKAAEVEAHKNAVLADLKATVDALPANKKFGNVGVVELTQNTPQVFANREAAASTEALDICIGEGGGGDGTRNLFTGKKDPRYTPIVNLLTGEPNPNASRHETSWVNAIYKGNELAMFRDLNTGMPIAAFQLSKASSLGPNGQQQFNIGYASGAGNKQVERQYIDGIRDYLNSHADKIVGTGDNLEKNTNIFNTKSKHSLRLAQSFAKLSDIEMKAVDWDSQPRFMTAKDIVQVAKGAAPTPVPVAPRSINYGPVNIQELKTNLVDSQTSTISQAVSGSNLDSTQELIDRLNEAFEVVNRNYFNTFEEDPFTAFENAIHYLDNKARVRRSRSYEPISNEMADALENYIDDLEAAQNGLQRQLQFQPRQFTQDSIHNILVPASYQSSHDAHVMMFRDAIDDILGDSLVPATLNRNPIRAMQDVGEEILNKIMFLDEMDSVEARDYGFTDESQRDLVSDLLNNAFERLETEITNLRTERTLAVQRAREQAATQQQQSQSTQVTADDVMNAMMLNRPQNELHAYELLHQAFDDVFNLDEFNADPLQVLEDLRNQISGQTMFIDTADPEELMDLGILDPNQVQLALRELEVASNRLNEITNIIESQNRQAIEQPQTNLQTEMQQHVGLRQLIDFQTTADPLVNDALQSYSQNLQQYAANQAQNGMAPVEIADSVRSTIETLRNLILTQPTDFTRNFTPDQIRTYVGALRNTIDGIGQWLGGQQQPQRANLPAEVQQNIDNRNRQITSAYQRSLDPDSAFSNTNDALSEFIDLLDGMSTNLFGNGYNASEIIDRLQARIRAEIIVLANPDNVTNRGLNNAEADILRNRLNNAYGSLAIVHDQLNAEQIGQHQAAQQSREQQRETFDNVVAGYINSQISALQNEGTPAATEAVNNILSTITRVAVGANMFSNPQTAIQMFRRGASSWGSAAARRVLSGIANTIAMNHPDLVAQQPAQPEPMVDLNFEPDATHPANQQYTVGDAISMAQDLFEQERTGANTFNVRSIRDSIHALQNGVFDDERIRRLSPRDQASFSEEVAFRLQNMLDDIRNRRSDRDLVADPGDAREALDNALSNIENDYGADVANDARMMRQSISEHVNPGDELSEYVYQLRRNRPGMSEDLRQALDHMAEELESISNEVPRNAPTPVPAQPATAPYRPIPENIARMSDRALTADMTPQERERVQVIFEELTDVNSLEQLQNIVGLVRSHVMQIWQAISDAQREVLARSLEEYVRDNTPPNTPPEVDNVFGATGQVLRITDRDRELYAMLSDVIDNAIEEGTPLPDPTDGEAYAQLILNDEIGGEFTELTDTERRRLASIVRRYGADATLPPEGHKDGGRIRKYKKGGRVHQFPSVDQMKLELMMRRA